jgi:hypothetical protein
MKACSKVTPYNSIFHNGNENITETKPGMLLELNAVISNDYICLNIITSQDHWICGLCTLFRLLTNQKTQRVHIAVRGSKYLFCWVRHVLSRDPIK